MTTNENMDISLPTHKVKLFEAHKNSVYICMWNPTNDVLASGSCDTTARLWNMNDNRRSASQIVLGHAVYNTKGTRINPEKDVSSLDWNRDGTLLATACLDGIARIWGTDGRLVKTLDAHARPIFVVKWNKKGNYLLSGSADNKTIIWDAQLGEVVQEFAGHSKAVIDVDWKTNDTFVSCSIDRCLYVCKLGLNQPIKTYRGHTDEVHVVQWNPEGTLLASCSNDKTLKIWSERQYSCIQDLTTHSKTVWSVKWSPTGPGSDNPNSPVCLASASFDSNVFLWDVERGTCIHELTAHEDQVYGLAFSPDGKFVATSSSDKFVHIWNVASGSLVNSYQGTDSIFHVCWNNRSDKVGASDSGGKVIVLDLRM